ncbi:MAG TPA: hypothetical protein VFG22_11445, partial [Polyangiales bacterium]|nr:hypothetical protein [Polyangiales bacterium]
MIPIKLKPRILKTARENGRVTTGELSAPLEPTQKLSLGEQRYTRYAGKSRKNRWIDGVRPGDGDDPLE